MASVFPSTVCDAVKRLQPVEPATFPCANVMLGATSSQPATSIPPASVHGVGGIDDPVAAPSPSSPNPVIPRHQTVRVP
jgi:hypothetical protein